MCFQEKRNLNVSRAYEYNTAFYNTTQATRSKKRIDYSLSVGVTGY